MMIIRCGRTWYQWRISRWKSTMGIRIQKVFPVFETALVQPHIELSGVQYLVYDYRRFVAGEGLYARDVCTSSNKENECISFVLKYILEGHNHCSKMNNGTTGMMSHPWGHIVTSDSVSRHVDPPCEWGDSGWVVHQREQDYGKPNPFSVKSAAEQVLRSVIFTPDK